MAASVYFGEPLNSTCRLADTENVKLQNSTNYGPIWMKFSTMTHADPVHPISG